MKMNESVDGAAQDGTDSETFCISSLCQLVTEKPGDATHKRDWHPGKTIGADIIAEEIAEVIDHDLLHGMVRQMTMDERGEGGQETIGHGFAVDTLDHIGHRQTILTLKFRTDIF